MSNTTRANAVASHPLARLTSIACLLCATALLAGLLYNHYQVIDYPYPLDYNEAAVPIVTGMIAQGENPFALEHLPQRTSVYPVMANLVAAPLANVFGNSLGLHRIISAICILASVLLLAAMLFRRTGSAGASFVAAALIYAAFIYYSTPIGGPNGVALLLFIASIAIPWLTNFSRAGLLAAIIVGVLAFYGKQYLLAGLGYVALYLFLSVSKRAGILFGLAFVLGLGLSVPVVMAIAPYYYDSTFFLIVSGANALGSMQVMLRQLVDYSGIVYGLLIILGLAALHSLRLRLSGGPTAVASGAGTSGIDLRNWDAPLLGRGVDYFVLCLLCSTVVFVFVLGTNPGNHLSYLFQIVSPFLVLVVLDYTQQAGALRWICQLLLIVAMYHAYAMQSHDFSVKHTDNWQRLDDIISASDEVYVSNVLLGNVLKHGKEVHQDSHTPYFYFASLKPRALLREPYEVSTPAIWLNYVTRMHDMIRQQAFDAILIDYWTQFPGTPPGYEPQTDGMALLKTYYEKEQILPVSVANRPGGGTYPIQVWRPKLAE